MVKKVKGIVRVASTDMAENISIEKGLKRIRGISHRMAKVLCIQSQLDSRQKVADIDIKKLEELENKILNIEMPDFMKNRREYKKSSHIIIGDIDLKKREDINTLQKLRAYRGIRHEQGLPVRGQRTRSSFRKNKTVGVSRKKAMAAKSGK